MNQPETRPSNPEISEEPARSDRDLLEGTRQGDQQAFRVLFERYHRRAYAVALGVVKNEQDAADIVQDAFVKVYRHLDSFQGNSSFYTWLYRILMNLSIDHIRKHHKGKDLDYDDGALRPSDEFPAGYAGTTRVPDSNPSKAVIRRELSKKVMSALSELPPHHRAVIVLREVEGLSYEEMAEVLEVPKGTIMSRLFHARKKLQAELEEYVSSDWDAKD